MHKFLKTFPETGSCELDIDKTVSGWKNYFFISQWKEEYTIVLPKSKKSKVYSLKASISSEQALELIGKLHLLPIRSMLKSAKAWRMQSFIETEIERFSNLKKEKVKELQVLTDVLKDYETALYSSKLSNLN